MRFFFIFIVLACTALTGFAQYKYEKEIGIGKKDIPPKALSFIDSLQINSKIKWYKEIGQDKISFEAKAKHKGKKTSIEFSDIGTFEDIEIEIKPKEINTDTHAKISQYLASQYAKYSIEKVQIQYSGDPNAILDYFIKGGSISSITIRFEIVISTKVDGSFARFEYLFSENGELIQKWLIPAKMNDNIEY